jgi:3-oxoadipate enol-lactonase
MKIRNKKMAVETQGSGEPVILIHGLGGTTNVWGAQVEDLSRRFKVVRVDLEGSGRSPTASKLSVQGWVDDLVALADAESFSTLRVVGHSLGTLIAQHFTAQNPGRVARLALLGINRAPVDARRQVLRDRAAKVREGGLEAIVDNVVSAGISPHSLQNPLVEPFARELVLRQSAEGYARSCEAVAEAVAADLLGVKCPVLLVAGEDDTVSPPRISETVASELDDAKVIVLKQCGHWMPIERPAEVNRALMDFL